MSNAENRSWLPLPPQTAPKSAYLSSKERDSESGAGRMSVTNVIDTIEREMKLFLVFRE